MGLMEYISELFVKEPARLSFAELSRFRKVLGDQVKALRKCREEDEAKHRDETSDSLAWGGLSSVRYKTSLSSAEIQEQARQAETFARHLMRLVERKCDGRVAMCYKRAGLSRQVYSYIINNPSVRPARETVLRLAIGLQLSYEEAASFMGSAGYAFCPSDEMGVAFVACFKQGVYSIFDINELLVSIGLEPLKID